MEEQEGLYTGWDYAELAREFRRLESEKDLLEGDLAELNKKFDYLRKQVIPNKMEADGLQTVAVRGVGRFSVTADLYTNVPAEERFNLQSWLAERGFESLIQPTVNGSTLKSFIKERMKAGDEVPPMVKIEPYQRASLTKISS